MNFIVLLSVMLSFVQSAYADCFTGFACSIDDLEKRQAQQNIEIIYLINDLFDRKVQEPVFTSKNLTPSNYHDLFIYKGII